MVRGQKGACMRSLLFLPAVLIFALFFANAAFQACKAARKEREAEAARKAKAEAAARAKAERDALKAAAKAAKEAEEKATPKRKRGRPRKEPEQSPQEVTTVDQNAQPVQKTGIAMETRTETISRATLPFKGNNAFAGEIVAFTGTLDGMTRAEAIKAVEDNGGRAFETMPAGTTILVVGSNPGMNKLDKADRWIGQVRKITQEQFRAKLTLPLTLTPDEFAAHFAQGNQ